MISRLGSISANIVQFCRFLRTRGYTIGTEEEITSLNALHHIDLANPDEFLLAMKATLCKSKKQLNEFDELFFTYWKELKKAVDSKLKEEKTLKKNAASPNEQFKSLSSWLKGNQNNETLETASYSSFESLSRKDFSTVPDDEIDELMKCMKSLSRQLAASKCCRPMRSHSLITRPCTSIRPSSAKRENRRLTVSSLSPKWLPISSRVMRSTKSVDE